MVRKIAIIIFFLYYSLSGGIAQPFPSPESNIRFLFTSAMQAPTTLGDDDHIQITYFVIPENYSGTFFLWILNPGCRNTMDEIIGEPDSKFKFTLSGGEEVYSPLDQKDYGSGNVLFSRVFSNESFNSTFFPEVNPKNGCRLPGFNGRLFKIIVEGLEGDDGNNYTFFLSSSDTDMIPVKNSKFFFNEITFMMTNEYSEAITIHPYISPEARGITLRNFDFDDQGILKLVSPTRKERKLMSSGDNEYMLSLQKIYSSEKNNKFVIRIEIPEKQNESMNYATLIWLVEDKNGNDISLPFPESNNK